MKPLPNRVPRDAVTFVIGEIHDEYTTHCLVKNNKAVVVQSTFLPGSLGMQCIRPPENIFSELKLVNETLEILHSLLNSIEFGSNNWVYVNQTPGGYQIGYRRKSFQHLRTCELWAPFISEHEIEITGWTALNHATGYWKEQPVEIYYGWDEKQMLVVDKAMHVSRRLRGLNLTQEALGHLLDDEGAVIGLVVEAAAGRPVQLRDRTIVYEAIAKLQRQFCIFAPIQMGAILISGDSRVCFAWLTGITYYPPGQRQDFEGLAERAHWDQLEQLFAELEEGIIPPPHITFLSPQPVTLFNSHSPEKMLPLLATYVDMALPGLAYGNDDDEYNSVDKPVLSGTQSEVFLMIRNYASVIGTPLRPFSATEYQRSRLIWYEASTKDPPRKGRMSSTQRRASRLSVGERLYRGGRATLRFSGQGKMGFYSDSDCTSESGQSRIAEVF